MKTSIFLGKDFLNHLLSQLWMQSQHIANQEEKVSDQNNLRASKKVKKKKIFLKLSNGYSKKLATIKPHLQQGHAENHRL